MCPTHILYIIYLIHIYVYLYADIIYYIFVVVPGGLKKVHTSMCRIQKHKAIIFPAT